MSQSSQTSTIPYEILENQDNDFAAELNNVDELYFQANDSTVHVESLQNDYLDTSSCNFESDSDNESNCINIDDDCVGAACSDAEVTVNEHELASNIDAEIVAQKQMLEKSCCCNQLYGVPCSKVINFEKLIEYREYCNELTKEELDLVVKAELSAHRNAEHETVDGLVPRVHKLTNAKANHGRGLTYKDFETIHQFIINYAKDHALPLPGRLPNFRQSHVYVLPSDTSVSEIHQIFEASAATLNFRSVSLRTFQRVWNELCPHITLSKPSTDLCQKCQEFVSKIAASGSLEEEEKTNLLENYSSHVKLAKKQRDYYRSQCQESKQAFTSLPYEQQVVGGQKPCSTSERFHYSWDFAQQVHYPHHAQQVGPIFFKTPRKCGVFGICSEGSGRQLFYLIDETECAGKGANSVASMVHHYLMSHSHGECSAQFHFDNCTGQNKNNTILWYTLWRVMTGLHQQIEMSMMIAGHTKFDPDWHFGIWKNRWRHADAETMTDIARTVQLSSKNGHNVPQLISEEDNPVIFYEWREHLSQFFKPLKQLTTYHHFIVKAEKPGTVECREYADSPPIEINFLKKHAVVGQSLPRLTPIPGMDVPRQWYLYEQIRDFCKVPSNKDKCCPKPLVPKKESK